MPLQVIEKPWGTLRVVHASPAAEVHYASIRAGGASSEGVLHRHLFKDNDFYVISGVLQLWIGDLPVMLLGEGMHQHVQAGIWHRFHATTDVELIETYTQPAIRLDDIEREEATDGQRNHL